MVSKVLKEELLKRGINEEKILVNPNGVNTEVYHPAKLETSRKAIRKNLTIENSFAFGFIGTFSIWHGIEILAHIIPKIIEQNKNVHFILIGDGPLLPFLKSELKKKKTTKQYVTFTGILPSEQAKNYLAACDAFLSPTQPNKDGSRFFGSPTKIFEYLSLAKPIIASDLEQVSELIQPAFKINNKINSHPIKDCIGIAINPTDKNSFVEASCFISRLDKAILQKMGSNARQKAINCYRWQQHIEKIISFVR